MNVLALNPGSNSLKFQIVDAALDRWGQRMLKGSIEPVGRDAAFTARGEHLQIEEKTAVQGHAEAVSLLLDRIRDGAFRPGGIRGLQDLDLVVCRVVHGADRFREPVLVDRAALYGIEALGELAPLHNANSVAILRMCRRSTNLPLIAVFDSAFHSTIPEVAYRYAIDFDLAERHRIRRYGFHGISHRYLLLRYAELCRIEPEQANIITLHLEGGSSATAIRAGQSVDTSMGFTPLEGLIMGTRSGDVDPALIGYLARKEGVDTGVVEEWLNSRSGLLGVSNVSQDTRVLVRRSDRHSQLALDMFAYRVRKYIGAYVAAIGGASAIVFGGGIGENTPEVRRRICTGLGCLGLELDNATNEELVDREGRITRPDSRLHAFVIPTEEGLMMSREAVAWMSRVVLSR